jgi:hypothetical protein
MKRGPAFFTAGATLLACLSEKVLLVVHGIDSLFHFSICPCSLKFFKDYAKPHRMSIGIEKKGLKKESTRCMANEENPWPVEKKNTGFGSKERTKNEWIVGFRSEDNQDTPEIPYSRRIFRTVCLIYG